MINIKVTHSSVWNSQTSFRFMNILYRQATPDDAEDISKMICEALRITNSKNYSDVIMICYCSILDSS